MQKQERRPITIEPIRRRWGTSRASFPLPLYGALLSDRCLRFLAAAVERSLSHHLHSETSACRNGGGGVQSGNHWPGRLARVHNPQNRSSGFGQVPVLMHHDRPGTVPWTCAPSVSFFLFFFFFFFSFFFFWE